MRMHVANGNARKGFLHQWHKSRYMTDRSEARTLSVEEIKAFAESRGLTVSDTLTQRRAKHA